MAEYWISSSASADKNGTYPVNSGASAGPFTFVVGMTTGLYRGGDIVNIINDGQYSMSANITMLATGSVSSGAIHFRGVNNTSYTEIIPVITGSHINPLSLVGIATNSVRLTLPAPDNHMVLEGLSFSGSNTASVVQLGRYAHMVDCAVINTNTGASATAVTSTNNGNLINCYIESNSAASSYQSNGSTGQTILNSHVVNKSTNPAAACLSIGSQSVVAFSTLSGVLGYNYGSGGAGSVVSINNSYRCSEAAIRNASVANVGWLSINDSFTDGGRMVSNGAASNLGIAVINSYSRNMASGMTGVGQGWQNLNVHNIYGTGVTPSLDFQDASAENLYLNHGASGFKKSTVIPGLDIGGPQKQVSTFELDLT